MIGSYRSLNLSTLFDIRNAYFDLTVQAGPGNRPCTHASSSLYAEEMLIDHSNC
jgi:hypothetical protein